MALKREGARKIEGSAASVDDPKARAKWPNLMDHLTQAAWEDGTPRLTSTVSLFTGDGAFKALLKDREAGLCLWVAAPSLLMLWDVVEAALSDPGTVWRRDRQQPGEQATRVKKRTA